MLSVYWHVDGMRIVDCLMCSVRELLLMGVVVDGSVLVVVVFRIARLMKLSIHHLSEDERGSSRLL